MSSVKKCVGHINSDNTEDIIKFTNVNDNTTIIKSSLKVVFFII